MSRNTVSDYGPLINHQIILQEALLDYHLKAEAMLKVFLGSNLPSHSFSTIHEYLWGVSDTITQAKNLNEYLLNFLIRVTQMEPPKGVPGGNTVH